ncbi:Transcription regulator HTH, GntR [Syntrophomonas zehnderi OL-4]|uniref:Transcription regulator HTH, GntR n=1 Tax=Syntrophomonas zehnderi OL-4 TaxID=690567 RepID=A0A0E4C994_9FIRM|nr:GntR family transcriptional regulator [Syntrophomonas zehnderi]CFX88893.1 Transcription regulator HTH, GntR [Syntrophomonas zehnderi OL-4]
MENTPSTSDIYETLKKRIICLEYAPGQVLNEKDIANEFNLSRTPVRRVFEQLKIRKLLNIIPRFGAQVAPIDFLYIKSVLDVSRELEGFAAGLAAERISEAKIEELEAIVNRIGKYDIVKDYKQIIIEDQRFHAIVYESSGNPCLIEILDDLHMHTERMWLYVQPDINDINLFMGTLPNIINALKARDAGKASEYAKLHTDQFVEQIKQELL